MSATIQLLPLDNILLELLRAVQVDGANQLADIGSMPLGAGWGLADPNEPGAVFRPYSVLTSMTATPTADAGGLRKPQADWHIPYMVQGFGVRHDQARWIADKNRRAFAGLLHEDLVLGDETYRVQQVWTSQIGGVPRVPASEPPYFVAPDGITIWLAYRRTP